MNDLTWELKYDMYKNQLIDHSALMLTLSARVRETQQVLATQFSFRLRTPDLVIKVKNSNNKNTESHEIVTKQWEIESQL